MNDISFQGRTSLIFDSKKYDKVKNSLRSKRLMYNKGSDKMSENRFDSNNFRYLRKWNDGYVAPDCDHFAVILNNEKCEGFVKYFPITKNYQKDMLDIIGVTDALLKNAKEKLTAWIIGGSEINGHYGNKVVKALNDVAEILCDKPNIDTSILVGGKKGSEDVLVHLNKNKLSLTLQAPKNTDLEDMFDIVELNNTEII